MQKLTNKEEEVMHILWKLKKAFVKEVLAEITEEKPHYNTLSTIIRNLTTNAIKFTPKNKNIYLTTEIENDRVTISIKDEGVGIDEKNLKKLFNAAEDYKTPGTSGERGSGLGLLLCKDFVEKHGGTIWVESKVGKGSEFKFTINKA